jgi:hypothetical protein
MISVMLMMMAAAMPPNPTRASPPPGLDQRALPVGATAPALTLLDAKGGHWNLHGAAVLVFYRGHW